jgi:hypothetical protein
LSVLTMSCEETSIDATCTTKQRMPAPRNFLIACRGLRGGRFYMNCLDV